MRLEWDERKNVINRRKHGLDFSDAGDMFATAYLELDETAEEERWRAVGMIGAFVVIAIVTFPGNERIRMISLRKATKREQDRYFPRLYGE